jgi:hypothetical protein
MIKKESRSKIGWFSLGLGISAIFGISGVAGFCIVYGIISFIIYYVGE